MIKARVLTIPILCAVLGGSLLGAEARWEDNEYWYNLVESGDRSSFALILYSKRLQTLAEAAIVEAVRLDAATKKRGRKPPPPRKGPVRE